MIVRTLCRRGEYRDSVALMLLARELGTLPGVVKSSVVMGTPANLELLRHAGLGSAEADAARPNDLLIVVKAKDAAAASGAAAHAERLLGQRAATPEQSTGAGSVRPLSLRSAVRLAPHANVAVISVPGQFAAAPAWDALRAGLHVLLFSDHVAVEDEIALKQYAVEHGLLLMGPGAGTAILNGVGLGFANAVPRGPVGILAAAGTGLQEVSTLLAKTGVGVSHAVGVGGRDVSEAVGGVMLLEGLRMLQSDPATRVIVVVSKLPSPSVVDKLVAECSASAKPTVLALMSDRVSTINHQSPNANLSLACDLRSAAAFAAALAQDGSLETARAQLAAEDKAIRRKGHALRRKLTSKQRYLRGLFSGGTLCEEAMRIWQMSVGQVWSNAPLDLRGKLADSNSSYRHTAVDLGEEEFTLGRPHPMIDYSLRVERLLQEARDPTVAAIVLDVVLGYGAHPDPAGELGPAIAEARQIAAKRRRNLLVITSITGTAADPQGLDRQQAQLEQSGALVMTSNAAAAQLAASLLT